MNEENKFKAEHTFLGSSLLWPSVKGKPCKVIYRFPAKVQVVFEDGCTVVCGEGSLGPLEVKHKQH